MLYKLLYLFVYELIYMLFRNSNLACKLQLYYVALLVEFQSPHLLHVIVVCLDSFYKHYFSLR